MKNRKIKNKSKLFIYSLSVLALLAIIIASGIFTVVTIKSNFYTKPTPTSTIPLIQTVTPVIEPTIVPTIVIPTETKVSVNQPVSNCSKEKEELFRVLAKQSGSSSNEIDEFIKAFTAAGCPERKSGSNKSTNCTSQIAGGLIFTNCY